MAEENKESDAFFDHFSREDKPTGMGMWLVRALARRIFNYMQAGPGSSVLEIGPGRGAFANICIDNGIDYQAIEPNIKMADALEKQGVKVMRNIVPPFPDTDQSFDIVVMINVMEHMDTMTAALNLTSDIYKRLNPGGKFVIYSPDCLNWRHHFYNGDFSHNYITTFKRLQTLLINAGFKQTKGTYINAMFKGFVCFLSSTLVTWLPFGCLSAMFPKNNLLSKCYDMQITFLRRVLIAGQKT